jgi:microcystin-dependent protein
MVIVKFLTEYEGNVPNRQNDTPLVFAQNVYLYTLWIDEYFVPEMNDSIEKVNLALEELEEKTKQAIESAYVASQAKDRAEQIKSSIEDMAAQLEDGSINDGTVTNISTWSSEKINTKVGELKTRIFLTPYEIATNEVMVSSDIIIEDEFVANGELILVGTTPKPEQTRFSSDDAQAGEYKDFAMANPKGRWLFCDGREVDREEYFELFEALGTTYGKGNGATTFNIPDLRGYFKRSVGLGGGVDEHKNRVVGSKQGDEFKAHKHESKYSTFTSQSAGSSYSGTWYGTVLDSGQEKGGAETRPKNIAVYTCIRY